MEHRIAVTFEKHALSNFAVKRHIQKCILAALKAQGVNVPCEINVFVCGDETIRAINQSSRKIDKATDVLSFPMFNLTPGVLPESWEKYEDPGTGLVPLGDMAISLERAGSRQRNSATPQSARSATSPSTPFCTCSATTTWTRAR